MADPYRYFRIEANEIVDQLAKGLLDLDAAYDAALVAKLLRLAHTLKGAARIVKHAELATLSHQLEDALAPARHGATPLAGAVALVDEMAVHAAALVPPEPAREPPAPGPSARPAPSQPELDTLLAELADAHAQLATIRAAHPELAALDGVDRELRAARRCAEQLRLSPASMLFTNLERTARDAAVASGKEVRFVARGGDVRIDAGVLGGLHGALVQLVRNAVAHGIESAERRRAAHKDPVGRVAIELVLHGDRVLLRCEDDGAGIDLALVREHAIARGAIARGADVDAATLIDLLLAGGLSTSAEITPLAGRGIGLDVVRDAVRALGGELAVRTRAGEGTLVTIDVPAALAGVSALVVIVDHHCVAIPRDVVRRVIAVTPEALRAGRVAFESSTISVTPLVRLFTAHHASRPRVAVVVDVGGVLYALAVDRVLGIEELVVRPLARAVPIDPIVRGIALDDDGSPRPVLEPAAVVGAASRLAPVPEPPERRALPILVIDDSVTSRMLHRSILESAGYEVDTAESAEEALGKTGTRRYGLCIVDVELPGLDGFGCVAALRERGGPPAILVTSRDAPEDRERGERAGASGYITKGNFDQAALLALVGRLIA